MTVIGKNWSRSDWFKNLLTLFLPLCLFLIPTTASFTFSMKLFFVSTLMAIFCFAFGNVSIPVVASILPVFWIFCGVAEPSTVFQPWTTYIVWVIFAGLILAGALEETGLLKRIAYLCIAKVGATYNRIIIGIAVSGALCNIFIGDVTFPMAALCYGLCKALDLRGSKAAAGIMMTGVLSTQLPYLINFNAYMIQIGLGMEVTGPLPFLGYFESWYIMWPLLLYFVLMVAVVLLLFKPDKDQQINGREYFDGILADMGKMTIAEKKALVVLILYLAFIVTAGFGGRLSLEWGMVFIPMFLLLPGVGNGEKVMRQLDYGFVLFVASCMAIGTVAVSLGIGELLTSNLLPLLEGQSHYVFFIAEWLLAVIGNFVMTPMAVFAAFTMPLASLAQDLGINPFAVYQVLNFGIDQLLFPYESAMYMVFFAYGMMKMSDFIKFNGIKMVVNFVVLVAVMLPWWQFTGFLFR